MTWDISDKALREAYTSGKGFANGGASASYVLGYCEIRITTFAQQDIVPYYPRLSQCY